MSTKDRYTLFTNLSFVVVNGLRPHVNALLFEEGVQLLHPNRINYRIRGFGVESSWVVFDMDVASFKYEIVDAASHNFMVAGAEGGAPTPLVTGAILSLRDGPDIQLLANDNDRPIDVTEYDPGTDILKVWEDLPRKVAEYWTAPNMPVLDYVPAEHVRKVLNNPKVYGVKR